MKCYYHPEKECRWNCATRCDAGWDFVAGASPCRRDMAMGVLAGAVIIIGLGIVMVFL
jgi:hypothetical protein